MYCYYIASRSFWFICFCFHWQYFFDTKVWFSSGYLLPISPPYFCILFQLSIILFFYFILLCSLMLHFILIPSNFIWFVLLYIFLFYFIFFFFILIYPILFYLIDSRLHIEINIYWRRKEASCSEWWRHENISWCTCWWKVIVLIEWDNTYVDDDIEVFIRTPWWGLPFPPPVTSLSD